MWESTGKIIENTSDFFYKILILILSHFEFFVSFVLKD